MSILSREQLVSSKCKPCEGDVKAYTPAEAETQLAQLYGWRLTSDGKRIRKDWRMKNFMAAMNFFNHVAALAEMDGHHPDLHLEGYRSVWIELFTHAIDGLSENDFVLAAKIDELPIQVVKQ